VDGVEIDKLYELTANEMEMLGKAEEWRFERRSPSMNFLAAAMLGMHAGWMENRHLSTRQAPPYGPPATHFKL
jgi:hypothetical protein